MQLEEISTKNIGETGLNPRMKYIIVRLDNIEKKLYKKGKSIQESLGHKVLYTTQIYWVEESTQSVWNVGIKFDTWEKIESCTVIKEKSVKRKSYK